MDSVDDLRPQSLKRFRSLGVREHLRSNRHLSASERDRLVEFLRDAREDGASVRRRILGLQDAERELDHCIAQCESLLSPIRRLPDEILSGIFAECREENLITPDGLNKFIPGHCFELVCSHWRTVALSTPRLWSEFRLEYTQDGYSDGAAFDPDRCTSLLKIVLRKSKREPLDISVSLYEPDVDVGEPIHLICSQSFRWRSIDINSGDLPSQNHFSEATAMPLLEHAELSTELPETSNDLDLDGHILSAPNITSASLASNIGRGLPPMPPNNHIQELELVSGRWPVRLQFLRSTDFTASRLMIRLPIISFIQETPVELPSVRYLTIAEFRSADKGQDSRFALECILSSFRAPNLEELYLRSRTGRYLTGISNEIFDWPIQSFASHVPSKLTRFIVEGVGFPKDTFISTCKLLPDLKHLRYEEDDKPDRNPDFPSIISEFLRRLAGYPRLLPKLESLDLSVRCADVPDKLVVDVFACRSAEGLRTFKLTMRDRAFSPSALRALKDLRTSSHAEVKGNNGNLFCSCSMFCSSIP